LFERQLQRRCLTAFSYPPSTLARVLRLQRFLSMIRSPRRRYQSLSDLAAAAGYADQAHLARDCLELIGQRPLFAVRTGGHVPGVRSVQATATANS
jgi:transcriptional regulator GlxA family with amidase domain